MPTGNPEGYLKKPKSPKKEIKKKPMKPKAKTTTELEKRLKERRKKAKQDRYLSSIEGN